MGYISCSKKINWGILQSEEKSENNTLHNKQALETGIKPFIFSSILEIQHKGAFYRFNNKEYAGK